MARWQGIQEVSTAKCDGCGARRDPSWIREIMMVGGWQSYCAGSHTCRQRVQEKIARHAIGLHQENYTQDEWDHVVLPQLYPNFRMPSDGYTAP